MKPKKKKVLTPAQKEAFDKGRKKRHRQLKRNKNKRKKED